MACLGTWPVGNRELVSLTRLDLQRDPQKPRHFKGLSGPVERGCRANKLWIRFWPPARFPQLVSSSTVLFLPIMDSLRPLTSSAETGFAFVNGLHRSRRVLCKYYANAYLKEELETENCAEDDIGCEVHAFALRRMYTQVPL